MKKEDIIRAIDILEKEGVIIYPSESCYSFGSIIFSKKAKKRIHQIKKEPLNKPYTIICNNLKQVKQYGILNKSALELIKKLCPGQINFIIRAKKGKIEINHLIKNNKLSFRITKNKLLRKLCEKFPITTTSVNIHGKKPMYNINQIKKQFGKNVDFILNDGNLNTKNSVSTIYDTISKKTIRKGSIKVR